jgi:hypothetical protein
LGKIWKKTHGKYNKNGIKLTNNLVGAWLDAQERKTDSTDCIPQSINISNSF